MKTSDIERTLDDWHDEVRDLRIRVEDLENELWKIKNPAKFSNGDEVVFKSGSSDYAFRRAKVVKVDFVEKDTEDEPYWKYTLWVYEWNQLIEFHDDKSFFSTEHHVIKKHEE
jgi:hypothetical protein